MASGDLDVCPFRKGRFSRDRRPLPKGHVSKPNTHSAGRFGACCAPINTRAGIVGQRESAPNMTEETLRGFLERRERELANQIVALEGALREKQLELAQVRIAKERVEATGVPDVAFGVKIGDTRAVADPEGVEGFQKTVVNSTNRMFGPDASQLSIESLIQRSLLNRGPQGGTAPELCIFIRDAYGRDVQLDSLRAQLARSRSKGMVEQHDGRWFLTRAGRWYGDPPTRSEGGPDTPGEPKKRLRDLYRTKKKD
jgi:hypothetical protein